MDAPLRYLGKPMSNAALDDKVVLVTGVNKPHGIGAAVAKAFAAQRAKVFLHYFRSKDSTDKVLGNISSPCEGFYNSQQTKSPDEVLKAIRDLGIEAHAWEADLSDAAIVPELFNQVEKGLGPMEGIVNNEEYWEGDTFLPAGADLTNKLNGLWTDRPQTVSAGSFDRIFDVNTRAPALLMAEFARRLIERGAKWGRIVNVSTAGANCFPSEISYGASKLALEGEIVTPARTSVFPQSSCFAQYNK